MLIEELNSHFAKPVLWDSFKNLLGWAFKQQNTNGNELQKN